MSKLAVIGLVLISAACQVGPARTASIPSASAVAATSATPTPLMTAPVAVPMPDSVQCKLPISDGTSGSGGFITYPGGQFQPDPTSQVMLPQPAAGNRQAFGLTYGRGLSKWVPVPRDWVSPDGSRYAYPSPNAIEVVDVSSGAVVSELGKGSAWQIMDVENSGVYAYQVLDAGADPTKPTDGYPWLLPFAGVPHAYGTVPGYPITVHWPTFFYLNTVGASFPTTNEVQWEDLLTNAGGISFGSGKLFKWPSGYRAPAGTQLPPDLPWTFVGIDSNDYVYGWFSDRELWYASDGIHPRQLNLGADTPRTGPDTYSIVADAHGTWIATDHGLYLLAAGTEQLQRAPGARTGNLAGSCA